MTAHLAKQLSSFAVGVKYKVRLRSTARRLHQQVGTSQECFTRMVKVALFVMCFEVLANNALQPSNGDFALSKADTLAEMYNWHAAAPHYAEAEKFFTSTHDTRKALLAHIGYIRGTFEQRSFSDTARYFSNVCDG